MAEGLATNLAVGEGQAIPEKGAVTSYQEDLCPREQTRSWDEGCEA